MQLKNNHRPPRSGLIAALDLGTSKITCFIARPLVNNAAEVIGIGHQIARGTQGGNIAEMDAVEASALTVVADAEKMAGENVEEVVVSMAGGVPMSKLISFDFSIEGHEIGDADLGRALNPDWLYANDDEDRQVIHTIPIAYSVDENTAIRDPRGMYGEKLGVNMHVVSVAKGAERNLRACISRCRLGIESRAVAPYASGLACLVEDEKKLGAVVIDMGGGTTTLAVFVDGAVVHTDCIPLGGDHVTNDIARGLSAPLSFAERSKALYGSAIPSPSDDQEILTVPLVGEAEQAEANRIPRSMLIGIIRPRIEEIFEIVRARLEATGFDRIAGRRVVLTGGASQLTGVRELASDMLDKQIRLGRPLSNLTGSPGSLRGLPEAASGPAFATCAGLVHFTLQSRAEAALAMPARKQGSNGYFNRFGNWVRKNVLPSPSPLHGG